MVRVAARWIVLAGARIGARPCVVRDWSGLGMACCRHTAIARIWANGTAMHYDGASC